ncbi:MAG: hypothetical protein NC095_09480 [Muribaculum sp.]|nr:hypothetical protein [Muribaculum sp.]
MEITLYYPPKKWLEARAQELERQNDKYSLQMKYSQTISNLRSLNVSINLKPGMKPDAKVYPDDLANARRIVRSFMDNSYNKVKLDWARFNALMECDPRNTIALLDVIKNESTIELMHKVAQTSCVTLDDAWKCLGYDDPLPEIRYFYSERDLPKEWRQSAKAKELDGVVKFEYGPDYSSQRSVLMHRLDYRVFLLPNDQLILWDVYKRHGDSVPRLTPVPNLDDTALIVYDGSDFISQLPIFAGMKTAGIIKAGTTKIPVNVVKKVSSLMNLTPLPKLQYTQSDRAYILSYLGAYANIKADGAENTSDIFKIVDRMLPPLYACINSSDSKIGRFLLEDSVPKLNKYGLEEIMFGTNVIIDVMHSLMKSMPTGSDNPDMGEWVSAEDVFDWIAFEEASRSYWVNWIQPSYFTQISSSVNLSYPDYYGRVKLPVIKGLILMIAALGLIDIAFEPDGEFQKLKYLRITNAGLWISKRCKSIKVEMKKIDDGMHFDPDSLMITIRDKNSPNFALLNDLTEKITSNRFKITGTALLRGCKSSIELKTRIDRLKDYLLGGVESDSLSLLIAQLYARINKVKPAVDSEYYIMDVDPNDNELHKLITSNSQIRKNTLRVEGWKLLVKKSFYSTFIDKLRQSGYLTES